MSKTEQSDSMWRIRNVDPAVRKAVKLYAIEHDLTVAEALKELVSLGLDNTK